MTSEVDNRRVLTDEQREQVKARHAEGLGRRRLAAEFGVSIGCIRGIVEREKRLAANRESQARYRAKNGSYTPKQAEYIRRYRAKKRAEKSEA